MYGRGVGVLYGRVAGFVSSLLLYQFITSHTEGRVVWEVNLKLSGCPLSPEYCSLKKRCTQVPKTLRELMSPTLE